MSIPLRTTYFFQEEDTDGHHPMKFECSDNNIYYCKYRLGVNKEEIDFLAYEIIANQLLLGLKILTPDFALVQISPDSATKKDVKFNKRAFPNGVCFGSRMVKAANLVNATQRFERKRELNRYVNPEDIIKMAAFDMMVDNRDRGKEDNLNILEAEEIINGRKRLKFYAMDHAFIFGGQEQLRFFKPSENLRECSQLIGNHYFISLVKLIPKKRRLQILEDFVTSYNESYDESIQNAFKMFHESWQIPPKLNEKVFDFLSNKKRLDCVSVKMNDTLKLL